MSNFSSNHDQSDSSSCLARTLTNCGKMGGGGGRVVHPAWSMSSLITALPESPSPFYSHTSTHPKCHPQPYSHAHTRSYSDNATEFSTPRNQRFGMACIDNNNCSTCFSDIDEWLEYANKFCKSSNYQTDHLTEHGSPEEDLRISAICNNFLTAPEHELYNITLPSIREESPVFHGQTHLTCINNRYGAYKSERRRLMSRLKPYDEFLNEVRRKKLEAARDARKKAKHVELMHRLRRKEDAINDWEMQQTRKAMDEMDKIQNELERKQLMASARTQRKICFAREKAEKQKLNLRRSTMKKFQQLQIPETRFPSRLPLC